MVKVDYDYIYKRCKFIQMQKGDGSPLTDHFRGWVDTDDIEIEIDRDGKAYNLTISYYLSYDNVGKRNMYKYYECIPLNYVSHPLYELFEKVWHGLPSLP